MYQIMIDGNKVASFETFEEASEIFEAATRSVYCVKMQLTCEDKSLITFFRASCTRIGMGA
jgi:hypothetical protein